MPTEVRRLYFSDTEVAKALLAFNTQSKQKFLPPGGLHKLALRADPDLIVELSIETVAGHCETIIVNESVLGAAIIRFCISTGVPLPVNSSKSIKLANGQLAFDISLPREAAVPPLAQ